MSRHINVEVFVFPKLVLSGPTQPPRIYAPVILWYFQKATLYLFSFNSSDFAFSHCIVHFLVAACSLLLSLERSSVLCNGTQNKLSNLILRHTVTSVRLYSRALCEEVKFYKRSFSHLHWPIMLLDSPNITYKVRLYKYKETFVCLLLHNGLKLYLENKLR